MSGKWIYTYANMLDPGKPLCDPTYFPLGLQFLIKNKQKFKVLNSRWHLRSMYRKLPSIQRVKFFEQIVCVNLNYMVTLDVCSYKID